MALCKKCFKEIHDEAKICHECGSSQSRIWSLFTNATMMVGFIGSVVSLVSAILSYNFLGDVEDALAKANEAKKAAEDSLNKAEEAYNSSQNAVNTAKSSTDHAEFAYQNAISLRDNLNDTKAFVLQLRQESINAREQFSHFKNGLLDQQHQVVAKINDLNKLADETKVRIEELVHVHRNERGIAIDFDNGVRMQWGVITVNESDSPNRVKFYPYPFNDDNVAISMTYNQTNNTKLQDKVLIATKVQNDRFVPTISGKSFLINYEALDVGVSYIAIGATPEHLLR